MALPNSVVKTKCEQEEISGGRCEDTSKNGLTKGFRARSDSPKKISVSH